MDKARMVGFHSTPVRKISPAPAHGLTASRAFFTVLNACGKASGMPHPVHARNAGLTGAWEQWIAGRADELDETIASRHYRWQYHVQAIEQAMRIDPACLQGQIKLPANPLDVRAIAINTTAPLMFWRWPHALFELTPALEQILTRSDLGADIPANLLRPPIPACYIRLSSELQKSIAPVPPQGDGFAYKTLEGIYVFESVRGNQRAITLAPAYVHANQIKTSIGMIEMLIDEEQRPLVDLIQRICSQYPNEAGPHFESLAQICVKVFLYLSATSGQRVEENPYTQAIAQLKRVGPKKKSKLRRQVEKLYDRILLGPLALPSHINAHEEVSPHWRRGHFRMQAHGPQNSLRKVIFILPTLVRADRLEQEK
jgi:hypothetical protein